MVKYAKYACFNLILITAFTNIHINCWWNEGHMIVANIAKKDLLKRQPEAFSLMSNLTTLLEAERHGAIKTLVESATWPDLVKTYGLKMMDAWHFRDLPVNYSDPNPPVIDHKLENNALFFIVSVFPMYLFN